jgi:hypothetical protein
MISSEAMERNLDFYDAAENAMNEVDSEEEMATEYMENEEIERELEAEGGYKIENKETTLTRVFDYLEDKPCCSKNCCGTWKEDDLIKHDEDMRKLSKTEKKLVLLSILRNGALASENTRYSEYRQRLRFTFRYEPFGKMCASAFRLLFDIRIEALKGLLAHLKSNNLSIVPPIHGNKGKKVNNKSNSLASIGVTEKVVEFILALGEAQGEFSPGRHTKNGNTKEDKDPDVLWLPGCFTRSAILRMYNQQHPDLHIGRTAFCSLLKNEPKLKHIKIRSPRSDMCDFCEIQKRNIAGIKPYDESRAEKLTAELMAHQKAYQGERDVYNTEREQGKMDRIKFRQGKRKADECVEHISIDYGQSIGVPHTTDQLGGTFFLHMRNFHLFGICSVLENTQVCYTYDEREAGKGSNEVISFLHDFFSSREIQTPNIKIHADNCKGQNKNKYVIWYLQWLVATGRAKHIEFKFMIKGHTHCIVDSGIGHTKRELRRSDVFCLDHWAKVIDRSARTNKARVVDGNDVYDWKRELARYFKALVGISKFQHFAVDSATPGWVWVKYGFNDDDWKKKKLLKSETSIRLDQFINLPKYLSTRGFKGGKPEKERALFENLRQYVKDDWKDELCPDPRTFVSPIRDERPCPDWT